MSMDLGMIVFDIAFSIIESIMLCYTTHVILKCRTKLRVDLPAVLVYLLVIEIQTFLSVNLIVKIVLSMILWALASAVLYRTKIVTGIICYAILMNCISAAETLMIVFSVCVGNRDMIIQWYAYVIDHIVAIIILGFLSKILVKIRDDLSWQEECLVVVVMVGILISEVATQTYKDVMTVDFAIWQLIAMILLWIGFFGLWAYLRNSIQVRLENQNEKQQLQKLQVQYQMYKDKQKDEERVRAIYHDMKNHLLVLQAQSANQAGSQEMIRSIQEQLSAYESYYHTRNSFLDIILREKKKAADERNVDFHVDVDFSKGSFIQGLDISTIFGNALDNAIEACEKLPEEDRFITVRAGVKNQFLIIQIENAAKEVAAETTSKPDDFLHGFGKKNIRRTVEKYGGQCQWAFEQGVYTLSVLIPLP